MTKLSPVRLFFPAGLAARRFHLPVRSGGKGQRGRLFRRLFRSLLLPGLFLCVFLQGQSGPAGSGTAQNAADESRRKLAPEQLSTLVADYQLRDTLTSSVAGAPPLAPLGSTAFESASVDDSSRRVLTFDPNNGVSLSSTSGLISSQNYSIVILFSLVSGSGSRRILDFKNGSSDFGLYASGDYLQFRRRIFTQGRHRIVQPNAQLQLALTRDADGNVVAYVNGVRQLFFQDVDGDAIISANNALRFFRDNAGDSEASAGHVARIRIYNGVLSGSEVAGLDRLPNAQAGCPSISGLTPNNGLPGSTVTISGSGLDGVNAVSFPNNLPASFTITGSTQLNIAVPPGAVSGLLTIGKTSCAPVQTQVMFTVPNVTPPALVADYRFQNGYQSSVGNPPPLQSLGSNTFEDTAVDGRSRRVLKFTPNNGVALFSTAGVISAQAYSVVMLFSVNETSGSRRLLDFKNGASDFGVYSAGENIQFRRSIFTQGNSRVLRANIFTQLAITRDTAGNVLVYVDGTLEFSFQDGDGDALLEGNAFRFFRDNIGDGEATGGYLARIRFFNTTLSGNEIAALDRLPAGVVTTVSAASFTGSAHAPESIVAAFGTELATSTLAATSVPLPTSLAGTSVKVKDTMGIERLAPLFFVAPTQINYQMPAVVTGGPASITVTGGNGAISTGTVSIVPVAPALFSANATGQGIASGVVLRVKADGTTIYEALAQFDAAQNRFVTVPIDLGPETGAADQVFLILYGTGLRGRSALSAVTATLGGATCEVLYVGPTPGFIGLDQVNLRIPGSLRGRGDVNLSLVADAVRANPLTVTIK